MARELTPDKIRATVLGRRVRGYDPAQTEQLLEEVAKTYGKVLAERDALKKEVESFRQQHERRVAQASLDLEQLSRRLKDREQRATDLEAELERMKDEQSKELQGAENSSEELADARAAQERTESELAEQRELTARLETREKGLVEQIAMLEAQLEQVGDTEDTGSRPDAMHLDERAVRALVRLDRAVETIERQARREAETMLKKARERADELVHSAETRRRRLEEEVSRLSVLGEDLRQGYAAVAHALDRLESPTTEADAGVDPEKEEPRRVPTLDARPVSDLTRDLQPDGQGDGPAEGSEKLAPDLPVTDAFSQGS